MLPTLKEILQLPAFAGVEVLCGHEGLEQPITWVHVAEILDAYRFLSGGELLLTTGLELARAVPPERVSYLRSLAEVGAHGLIVEMVQGLKDICPEMLRAARFFNFPLMVLKEEVRFTELTKAAHERILKPHMAEKNQPTDFSPILHALIETGRDKAFLQHQLGAVLSLPNRPRSTLLATLEALLSTQMNMAETARVLGVRRQTVYYRLEQLKAMLGDLDSGQRVLGLYIALELLRSEQN